MSPRISQRTRRSRAIWPTATSTTLNKEGAAGFARLTYHLLPSLRISAGVRYNWDRSANRSYNFSEFDCVKYTSGVCVTPGPGTTNAQTFSAGTPTWRIEADYDVTPVNLIYASYNRGYKPGGVNGSPCFPAQGTCPQVVGNTFQPEINDGFEIGSKNMFFDRSLRFNVDAFDYDHPDFPYLEQDPVPFDDGMANIPQVRDYGAEFEAHYLSTDTKFHMDGTLTLEKGEVIGKYLTIDSTIANQFEGPDYTGNYELPTFGPCAFSGAYYAPKCWAQVEAAAVNIQGKSPPAEPNVSGELSAAYDIDLGVGTLTPWAQVVYRGSEWARVLQRDGTRQRAGLHAGEPQPQLRSQRRQALEVHARRDKP